MFKILISDKFSEAGLKIFRGAEGFEADYRPGLPAAELLAVIGGYDGLVIRSETKVTSQVIEAANRLKVVGRAGAGVDNVDLAAATARGVCVMNTPGGNTVTTAEHTIAMLMSMSRNIPQATVSLKSGKWEKSKFQGTEICGKVLGVVGLGRIGRVVAERALGLGMAVLAYDPFVTQEEAVKMGVEKTEFDDLLARGDFITLHVPMGKDTDNIIRAETIAKMKKGVRIVNCARGSLVNEKDLCEALASGHVAAAALDVYAKEPCTDSPLFAFDNVVLTPHLGASTAEAQESVAVSIAEQMIDYLRNGIIVNAVNVPSVSGDLLKQIAPYITLGEKLGSLQGQLSWEIPSEMTIIYGGELAELPRKAVGIAVLKGLVSRFTDGVVNFINAPEIARRHGLEVREKTQSHGEQYTNFLTVIARFSNGKQRSLTGVKFENSDIRLTRYNDLVINIEPEGHMLFVRNRDVPGVVGLIGTMLGEAGVNIANLRLARHSEPGTALTIVTTDEAVPDETLKKLADHASIISVRRAAI